MKLNEIPKEELELMGYDDIAYYVLQESGKKMKLIDIFTKVCKTLGLPESSVENQIMDFFELMSTNKKFIMLENGFWDLQNRHVADIVIEDADDEEIENDIEEDDVDNSSEEEEDIFYDQDDDNDDTEEDELADLVVIDGDEEEQNL